MSLKPAEIKQALKGTVFMTYPTTDILNCCVMSNREGNWFAFFPVDLPPDERREIEESILEDMLGVSNVDETT